MGTYTYSRVLAVRYSSLVTQESEFPPEFLHLAEKAAIEAVCGCLKDCEGEVTLWQLQMSQVIESS